MLSREDAIPRAIACLWLESGEPASVAQVAEASGLTKTSIQTWLRAELRRKDARVVKETIEVPVSRWGKAMGKAPATGLSPTRVWLSKVLQDCQRWISVARNRREIQ